MVILRQSYGDDDTLSMLSCFHSAILKDSGNVLNTHVSTMNDLIIKLRDLNTPLENGSYSKRGSSFFVTSSCLKCLGTVGGYKITLGPSTSLNGALTIASR